MNNDKNKIDNIISNAFLEDILINHDITEFINQPYIKMKH